MCTNGAHRPDVVEQPTPLNVGPATTFPRAKQRIDLFKGSPYVSPQTVPDRPGGILLLQP